MAQFDLSRRTLLKASSCGFGYLAFSALSSEQAAAAYRNPLAAKTPHFQPRAKRVIFLCMRGGPSHVDTFDYKPQLQKDHDKAGPRNNRRLLASPWDFKRRGQSGLWISDLFPHVAEQADDLCVIKSMKAQTGNHQQAYVQLHTGESRFVRPSFGSWVLYGLGTESQNMPGFVSITPPPGFSYGGAQNYGSAFLPSIYQGTRLKGAKSQIPNIRNDALPREAQRKQMDRLQRMNRELLDRQAVDPESQRVEGLIQAYELGFRMQEAVPQVMDLQNEPESVRKMYGVDEGSTDAFGRQCLLARRFAEEGVRFIEVNHVNQWDHHGGLTKNLASNCEETDKPIAGLLQDLKQRGLLEDTLVIWGGEFGRNPDAQVKDNGKLTNGRDHNPGGFTFWMAGGGAKPGFAYGETDEYGFNAAKDPVGIHDFHATVLHMLGLDHTKLTYRYAGRDFRLTDVHGNVKKGIFA